MQDSLEDYIRISRNCKEGPHPVKKESLIQAQIKLDCDAKALQILQFAIDGKMRSDALFRCLPYISPLHYQDIVEERALGKLCGYPLCSKHIPEMPKKQFFISTRNNKVYDITDRKNFCSNFCYRASIHIKNQIDTSPLWLRKHNERAHFTLLNKTEKGLPGQVVEQGVSKIESPFTSISAFAQMSLDEAEELEMGPVEEQKVLKKPKKYQKTTMKTINEETEIVEEKVKVETKIQRVKEEDFVDIGAHLLKCFKDWFTLETCVFIHGEALVKDKLDEDKLKGFFDQLKIAESQIEQQKKYFEICKKLHLKELADEKFDQAVIGDRFKPVPDYQKLREENRELDVKVKSFFMGQMHESPDRNFPTIDGNGQEVAVLPLMDNSSQTALRRKIFLSSLNRTFQNLSQTLELSTSVIWSDLQALVKTFRLKADNIVFKPHVCTLVAVILLKILCLKDENLREILEEEKRKKNISLWLAQLDDNVVDKILHNLMNIDACVEDYITCR